MARKKIWIAVLVVLVAAVGALLVLLGKRLGSAMPTPGQTSSVGVTGMISSEG